MTYEELVDEGRVKLKNAPSSILALVPTYINLAIGAIAEDFTLPTLKRYNSVLTVVDQAWATMPTGFDGRLTYVGTADGEITIEDDLEALIRLFPGLDEEGDVESVALLGNLLYYQGIPTTATTLLLVYYNSIAELTEAGQVPSDIPLALHRDLIVNRACVIAFDGIESIDEDLKACRDDCWKQYDIATGSLGRWIAQRSPHVGRSTWDV